MGTRGPAPQRSDETIRRNIGEPIDTITIIGPIEIPDLDLGITHPLVTDLYQSMKDSAQAKYYEPSDWQYARLTFHVLNEMLLAGAVGAMKLTAVNQMLTSLLLTEGDRRRVRIEVERNPVGGEVLSLEEAFQRKLRGSS